MPRGYELNTYYDSQRAVFRRLYSTQIKYLSGTIDSCGLRNSDAYSLIISSLQKGLYESLSPSLYSLTYYGNGTIERIGQNKGSYPQDFMSPLELRMNAIAVRRAEKALNSIANKGRFTLRDIQTICYSVGQEVASQFNYLKTKSAKEFSMRAVSPVLSTKPIIKKYEHAIIMGTLPKQRDLTLMTGEQKQEKDRLVFVNNNLFAEIKARLIQLSLTTPALREKAFADFNTAFYETDVAQTHTLEISTLLLAQQSDLVTLEEIQINIEKLEMMLMALNRIQKGSVWEEMRKAGKRAREIVLEKYRVLPELYSGFYHTYIEADKQTVAHKNITQAARR